MTRLLPSTRERSEADVVPATWRNQRPQRGGPLSHAAILARELGVPAVLNVAGATQHLDGQRLTVDGDAGDVRWVMYGGRGAYHLGAFDGKSFTPETENKIPMYHDGRCYAAQTFNNTEPGFGGQPRHHRIEPPARGHWPGPRFPIPFRGLGRFS